MQKFFQKLLLVLILPVSLFTPFSLKSEKASPQYNPYLMVTLSNDNIIIMALNKDFKIENIGKEVKVYLTGEPSYISIDEIVSMGFLYINSGVSSVEPFEKDELHNWKIYNSNGILISDDRWSRSPDLSKLKKGELYIIKTDTQSFKYIPY